MLSKEEQKRLCNLYLKYQAEYNETHNTDILWNDIRPLLISMIGNTVKKLSKNHYVPDFEHRVEVQVDRVIKRYINNPSYNRDLPLTLSHWESVNLLYASGHDKLIGNYDHELEYENASYTEEEKDIKLVDIKGNRLFMDFGTKEFNFIREGEGKEDVIKALEGSGWKLTNK